MSRRAALASAVALLALGGLALYVLDEGRDCGEESFDIVGRASDAGVRECIWDAYVSGQRARSRHIRPTIEGDPITWAVRIRGQERVEIEIDSRQDRFSSREVTTIHCKGMGRDESAPLGGGPRLTFVGCGGGAPWQIP